LELDADERLRDASRAVPERGCLLELVATQVGDSRTSWWTLAFESFGPLDTVQESLRRAAVHVSQPAPPSLEGGLQLSYPEWLSRLSLLS
jgi:hypothetical protein